MARDTDSTVGLPVIRAYRPADRAALAALWQACGLTVWYNDPDTDIDLFQRDGPAAILVCEAGPRLIGSVCCGFDGHRGWLYYLGVHPDHRGHGLARRLVEQAEAQLKRWNAPKLQLMVRDSNRAVLAFYEALGYGRSPVVVMQRWLRTLPPPPPGENPPPGAPGAPPAPQAITHDEIDVTVTFLEMTEPPERPVTAPPALNLAILHARKPAVPFYRFLYNTVGERWLWWERRELSDAVLARIIQHPRVEVHVMYVDGCPGGFAEIDRRDPAATNLAYFGLMPDQIGRGLGLYLLDWAIDAAWTGGARRLLVNTCTLDHPKALGLYQHRGFRPYRREAVRIRDPRMSPAAARG